MIDDEAAEPPARSIDLRGGSPQASDTLAALAALVVRHAHQVGLEPQLLELVTIRVSQLNGCAYCMQRHSRAPLAAGERLGRLAMLPGLARDRRFQQSGACRSGSG